MHNQVAHQNVSLESSRVNLCLLASLSCFLSGSECTSFLVLQKEIRKKIHGKQPLFIFQSEGEAERQEGDRQRRDRGGDTWRDSSPSSSRLGGNLSRQYPKPGPRRSRHCSSTQLRRYLTEILSADPHCSLSVLGPSPPSAPHFPFGIRLLYERAKYGLTADLEEGEAAAPGRVGKHKEYGDSPERQCENVSGEQSLQKGSLVTFCGPET